MINSNLFVLEVGSAKEGEQRDQRISISAPISRVIRRDCAEFVNLSNPLLPSCDRCAVVHHDFAVDSVYIFNMSFNHRENQYWYIFVYCEFDSTFFTKWSHRNEVWINFKKKKNDVNNLLLMCICLEETVNLVFTIVRWIRLFVCHLTVLSNCLKIKQRKKVYTSQITEYRRSYSIRMIHWPTSYTIMIPGVLRSSLDRHGQLEIGIVTRTCLFPTWSLSSWLISGFQRGRSGASLPRGWSCGTL